MTIPCDQFCNRQVLTECYVISYVKDTIKVKKIAQKILVSHMSDEGSCYNSKIKRQIT